MKQLSDIKWYVVFVFQPNGQFKWEKKSLVSNIFVKINFAYEK